MFHPYEITSFENANNVIGNHPHQFTTLYQSSQNWHFWQHSLLLWWEYFLGVVVLSVYREFEQRVGLVTSVKGAKTAPMRMKCFVKNASGDRIGERLDKKLKQLFASVGLKPPKYETFDIEITFCNPFSS